MGDVSEHQAPAVEGEWLEGNYSKDALPAIHVLFFKNAVRVVRRQVPGLDFHLQGVELFLSPGELGAGSCQ